MDAVAPSVASLQETRSSLQKICSLRETMQLPHKLALENAKQQFSMVSCCHDTVAWISKTKFRGLNRRETTRRLELDCRRVLDSEECFQLDDTTVTHIERAYKFACIMLEIVWHWIDLYDSSESFEEWSSKIIDGLMSYTDTVHIKRIREVGTVRQIMVLQQTAQTKVRETTFAVSRLLRCEGAEWFTAMLYACDDFVRLSDPHVEKITHLKLLVEADKIVIYTLQEAIHKESAKKTVNANRRPPLRRRGSRNAADFGAGVVIVESRG